MSTIDKYERFEAWLKENGAQFDMVSLILIALLEEQNLCVSCAY